MSSQSWETRWENLIEQGRLDELGPKGREYYAENYGTVVEPEEPPYDEDFDYEDVYEIEIEY